VEVAKEYTHRKTAAFMIKEEFGFGGKIVTVL